MRSKRSWSFVIALLGAAPAACSAQGDRPQAPTPGDQPVLIATVPIPPTAATEQRPAPRDNDPAPLSPPPTVLEQPNGESLLIEDDLVGQGREVALGDRVTVHYAGRLVDGTEFDNSWRRGKPAQFQIGRGMLIKGWETGMIGMRVGGRRKLTIPPSLAYGASGRPPTIPQSATLLFDIELLSIP